MNNICRCKPVLGTYVEVSLTGNLSRRCLIDISNKAFTEIESIHNQMSFHKIDSCLSYINRYAYKQWCDLTNDLEKVIQEALNLSCQSHGLFDISIASQLVKQGSLPDYKLQVDENSSWQDIEIHQGRIRFHKPLLIDLGGIAKGYAVDKAMSIFDQELDVVVNAGGDIAMNQWQHKKISIRASLENDCKLVETPMLNKAIATSANYYLGKKPAIVSPLTNKPIKSSKTYSVFADNCMRADALTKLAFIKQSDCKLINELGAQLVSVEQDGNVTIH